MNNKIIENIKEENRKNEKFISIHTKDKVKKDYKEITALNYELGEEYFINTKSNKR